jgi:hypothetical protein
MESLICQTRFARLHWRWSSKESLRRLDVGGLPEVRTGQLKTGGGYIMLYMVKDLKKLDDKITIEIMTLESYWWILLGLGSY